MAVGALMHMRGPLMSEESELSMDEPWALTTDDSGFEARTSALMELSRRLKIARDF